MSRRKQSNPRQIKRCAADAVEGDDDRSGFESPTLMEFETPTNGKLSEELRLDDHKDCQVDSDLSNSGQTLKAVGPELRWDGPAELEVLREDGGRRVRARCLLPAGLTWGPYQSPQVVDRTRPTSPDEIKGLPHIEETNKPDCWLAHLPTSATGHDSNCVLYSNADGVWCTVTSPMAPGEELVAFVVGEASRPESTTLDTRPDGLTSPLIMDFAELPRCTRLFPPQADMAALLPKALMNRSLFPCQACGIWYRSKRNLQAHQFYYCAGRQSESALTPAETAQDFQQFGASPICRDDISHLTLSHVTALPNPDLRPGSGSSPRSCTTGNACTSYCHSSELKCNVCSYTKEDALRLGQPGLGHDTVRSCPSEVLHKHQPLHKPYEQGDAEGVTSLPNPHLQDGSGNEAGGRQRKGKELSSYPAQIPPLDGQAKLSRPGCSVRVQDQDKDRGIPGQGCFAQTTVGTEQEEWPKKESAGPVPANKEKKGAAGCENDAEVQLEQKIQECNEDDKESGSSPREPREKSDGAYDVATMPIHNDSQPNVSSTSTKNNLRIRFKSEPTSPRPAASPVQFGMGPGLLVGSPFPKYLLPQEFSGTAQASEILAKMSELVHRRVHLQQQTVHGFVPPPPPPFYCNPVPPKGAVCFECNITFNNIENYLVHKKHYCSSRRLATHKSTDFLTGPRLKDQRSPPYYKEHKEQAVSVADTANSKLPPGPSTAMAEPPLAREVIPSPKACVETMETDVTVAALGTVPEQTNTEVKSSSSLSDDAKQSTTCDACNITFSKLETFAVHKQYYCATRHDPPQKRSAAANDRLPALPRGSRTRKRRKAYEMPAVVPTDMGATTAVAATVIGQPSLHLLGSVNGLPLGLTRANDRTRLSGLPYSPDPTLYSSLVSPVSFAPAMCKANGNASSPDPDTPMDLSKKVAGTEAKRSVIDRYQDYHECAACKVSFTEVQSYILHKQFHCPAVRCQDALGRRQELK
uniref:Zinc finger protein, FOG family member 2a n=2 Tax=Eptatretus burgeri TaxID=7764 RepID=A0A8C4WPB7_EPTBU